MLNFDRNHPKLYGTGEKLPKYSGKIFPSIVYKKCGTYHQKKWSTWMIKLKFCTEANQTLLFKRLQNNFFNSRPLHGANISQIFPFTKTKEPHNIQLVPNIWSTSFHQPVKICIGSLAAGASFQLVPKYISKVKVIFQIFCSETIVSLENGSKGANFSNAVI